MEPTVVPFSSCLKGHHLWDNAPGFVSKLKHSMASWLPIISKMPFACPHFQTFKTEEEVLELTLLALSLSVRVHVLRCNVLS